jgi:hypothetical protein
MSPNLIRFVDNLRSQRTTTRDDAQRAVMRSIPSPDSRIAGPVFNIVCSTELQWRRSRPLFPVVRQISGPARQIKERRRRHFLSRLWLSRAAVRLHWIDPEIPSFWFTVYGEADVRLPSK